MHSEPALDEYKLGSKSLKNVEMVQSVNVIFRVVLHIASKPIVQMSLCIVNM